MILKSPPMFFLSFEVTEQMTAEMGTGPWVQNGCYINIISTIIPHNNNILTLKTTQNKDVVSAVCLCPSVRKHYAPVSKDQKPGCFVGFCTVSQWTCWCFLYADPARGAGKWIGFSQWELWSQVKTARKEMWMRWLMGRIGSILGGDLK